VVKPVHSGAGRFAKLRMHPMSLFESGESSSDIFVYAQALDGRLYHYRDNSNLEVDSIISLRDGRWAAVEVKLGDSELDVAADNLHRMMNKLDRRKIGDPAFLMILYAGEYGYLRDDGVYVAPIGCLGP
jgi:hypothetical protein